MNNTLEEIKSIYKPYKVTKKKNITIIDSTKGSFVIKNKNDERIKDTYNYLLSRNFDYFPRLANNNRNDVNIFEYIEDTPMPLEQKASDMMNIVSLLHNKTTYYKEVTADKYKEIYEALNNNIIYTKNYYDNLYYILIKETIPSPSEYLLLRNIYKLLLALDYANEELDNWYNIVKEDKKERVCFIHNNLKIEHFIKSDKGYLISWEKSKIDTPVLDLIKFYQNEYMNLNFEAIFTEYIKSYPLNKQEQKLLFITLSIPPIIELVGDSEIKITREVRKKLDYVFKTESLIKSLTTDEDK